MNAAARALSQGLVIATLPSQTRRITMSAQMIAVLSLIMAILISALAVITVIDNNRIAIGDLAGLQQTRDDLHTTYNQLLLEENTWSSPSRVEAIAQQNFGMVQPNSKQVVIVQP